MADIRDEWATPGMKEWVFWRDGMTQEEYDAEYRYFYEHIEDWQNGTYQPLWKQKETVT